jgi:hypothetical protein
MCVGVRIAGRWQIGESCEEQVKGRMEYGTRGARRRTNLWRSCSLPMQQMLMRLPCSPYSWFVQSNKA